MKAIAYIDSTAVFARQSVMQRAYSSKLYEHMHGVHVYLRKYVL